MHKCCEASEIYECSTALKSGYLDLTCLQDPFRPRVYFRIALKVMLADVF